MMCERCKNQAFEVITYLRIAQVVEIACQACRYSVPVDLTRKALDQMREAFE